MLSQTGWDYDWEVDKGQDSITDKKKKVEIPYQRKQVNWEKKLVSSITAYKQETDSWVIESGTKNLLEM